MMRKKTIRSLSVSLLNYLSLIIGVLLLSGCKYAILDPKGMVAADEKHLLVTAVLLMLIVVIPVIFLAVMVSWKYRAGNKKAEYTPDWGHSTILEIIWWTIPCIIIGILAVLTWIGTHQLDPYRPLDVPGKPIRIQVVALNWKWLFIYPDQRIASVNFVQFPVNQPVRFFITSDAPMNSFQIPRLAGQIYAMAGMQTKLNLIASEKGDYRGLSTNYSGDGFAGMKFIARASSQQDFDQWVKAVKKSHHPLSMAVYRDLMKPSENNPPEYFSNVENDLFHEVMMKFMMPMPNESMKDLENR